MVFTSRRLGPVREDYRDTFFYSWFCNDDWQHTLYPVMDSVCDFFPDYNMRRFYAHSIQSKGRKIHFKMRAKYEADFCERQKIEFRNCGQVKITTLQCFSNDSKVKLSRWIERKKIHSTLIMLAWVETQNALWLVYDKKPLNRDVEHTTKRYEVKDFADIQIEKETPDADDEVNWSLKIDGTCLRFCCKDDFHLREFLNLKKP